jgi:hypothetical protein
MTHHHRGIQPGNLDRRGITNVTLEAEANGCGREELLGERK